MTESRYAAKSETIDGTVYQYDEIATYWDRFDFYKMIGTPFAECKKYAKSDTFEKHRKAL